MGRWICDDRKGPEEYKKEREYIQKMSDEEFEKYIEKLRKEEKAREKASE